MNAALPWLALAACTFAPCTIILLAWWRLTRRLHRVETLQLRAASTDVPTSMLITAIAQVDARLQSLERTRPPAVPASTTPTMLDDRTYQLARRMATSGADARRIAESCDIALDEAELLTRLQAGASRAA